MNHTIRNLLIATALMVIGLVLTTSFISKERRSLSRGKQEITVYVAKKEIPPGTPASQLEEGGYLDTKQIVREDAPPSPVSDLKDLDKLIANDTVYKEDVLTMRAFDKEAGLSPGASIKGNQRLVSLPLNSANTVGGLVRPGDRVDFIATASLQTPNGTVGKTWFPARDIEIVETPQSLTPTTGDEPVVEKAPEAEGDKQVYVLKATDSEVAQLLFAQSVSDDFKLYMLLRPASGDTQVDVVPLVGPAIHIPKAPKYEGDPGIDQPAPNATAL